MLGIDIRFFPLPAFRPLRPWLRVCLSLFLLGWQGSAAAWGMIFYSTDDPVHNTNAPTGMLAGSGWQYQGLWNAFSGTAIAPHYFITAKHIAGTVGEAFILAGVSYTTTAAFEHPQADLRIWRVRETLPMSAELYAGTNEIGRNVFFLVEVAFEVKPFASPATSVRI